MIFKVLPFNLMDMRIISSIITIIITNIIAVLKNPISDLILV